MDAESDVDARTDMDGCSAHRRTNIGTNFHFDGGSYTDPHADTHAVHEVNPIAYSDTNGYTYAFTYTDGYPYNYSNVDAHRYIDSNCNSHSHPNRDSYTDGYRLIYSNTDRHVDLYAYVHANADSNSDSNSHVDAYEHTDGDAYAGTTGFHDRRTCGVRSHGRRLHPSVEMVRYRLGI